VAQVLAADARVELLASDLQAAELERAVTRRLPLVVVLGEKVDYRLVVRLRSSRLAPGVLVVAQEQTVLWSALRDAGARCLTPDIRAQDLVAAVQFAARGGCTSRSGNGRGNAKVARDGIDLLGEREMEVLMYLVRDLKYAEVAHQMRLAESTVKTYSARIRRKLGVSSKRDLSAYRFRVEAETEKD
jgi:DNA-binding NarL/FixJ family response regulator